MDAKVHRRKPCACHLQVTRIDSVLLTTTGSYGNTGAHRRLVASSLEALIFFRVRVGVNCPFVAFRPANKRKKHTQSRFRALDGISDAGRRVRQERS